MVNRKQPQGLNSEYDPGGYDPLNDPNLIPSGGAINNAIGNTTPPSDTPDMPAPYGGDTTPGSGSVAPPPAQTGPPAGSYSQQDAPGTGNNPIPGGGPTLPVGSPVPLQGGSQGVPGVSTGSETNLQPGASGQVTLADALRQNDTFNNNVVRRRVEGARSDLESQRASEMDTLMARLAEQGMVDSGANQDALQRLSERLSGQFGDTLSGIYADQTTAADNRMIELLSLSTGLSIAEAKDAVERYRIQEGGRQFDAGYGLDAQKLAYDMQNGDTQTLIDLLKLLYPGLSGFPFGQQ